MPSTLMPTDSGLDALGEVFDQRVDASLISQGVLTGDLHDGNGKARAAMVVIAVRNYPDLALLDASEHIRDVLCLAGQRIQAVIAPADGHWAPAPQHQLRVFLPAITRIEFDGMVQQLRNVLSAAYLIHEKTLLVTFDVAVAISPEHGSTARHLTRNAVLAVHGMRDPDICNYRLFDATAVSAARSECELEQDLRLLMFNRDTSQFEIAYQRLSRCDDGACTGGEALLRWRHPRLGIVPTDGMISMAERAGFIVQMGAWVLEQACRQASQWPAHWKVHVNVSVEQLRASGFVANVAHVLATSGLPATRLGLEITESLEIPNYKTLSDQLAELRALGVSIVLDDFGAGYSSLNHLQSLPLDAIKLDAVFAVELESSHRARAVIQALVAMAHALELEVVAEGVETPAQHRLLCDLGCDAMQGYLLGRPMSSADLVASGVGSPTMS